MKASRREQDLPYESDQDLTYEEILPQHLAGPILNRLS
jgi:hypothetical protein